MKTTTISAGIARNSKNEILLVEQKARDCSNWLLPGGSVDDNEDIEEGLRREFMEETGLVLTSIKALSYTSQVFDPVRSKIFNINVFEVVLKDGKIEPSDPDNEIIQAKYLPKDEAIKLLNNNKYSYAKHPAIDAIENFPNNYKYWEYCWEEISNGEKSTKQVKKLR